VQVIPERENSLSVEFKTPENHCITARQEAEGNSCDECFGGEIISTRSWRIRNSD